MKSNKKISKSRLIEFFIIGVFFGVIEDLIAISIATDGAFEWRYLFIAFIVALPFAVVSELVVDHPDFWRKIIPIHKHKEDNK